MLHRLIEHVRILLKNLSPQVPSFTPNNTNQTYIPVAYSKPINTQTTHAK